MVEGHYLQPGTILADRYKVGNVLGEGGFGITYVGDDLKKGKLVAIKEFYPQGYCTRDTVVTDLVTLYSSVPLEMINKWMNGFMREAKVLAECNGMPGVVGVRAYFKANNTAYIVMEYLEGKTLKTILKEEGRIPYDRILDAFFPLMNTLQELHNRKLIHRDISPDNIMVTPYDGMKLLDFGAARVYEADDEKSLSVLLKRGFAPIEQYKSRGNQGPWTDVYALCATMYRCITGIAPPEAIERLSEDNIEPLSKFVKIDRRVENAILAGLAVDERSRIQSVADLMAELYYSVPASEITGIRIEDEGEEPEADNPWAHVGYDDPISTKKDGSSVKEEGFRVSTLIPLILIVIIVVALIIKSG